MSSTSRLLYEPVPSRAMTEFVMGGIPQEQTKGLTRAYLEIRHLGHHHNLPETSRKVGDNQLLTERSCLATAVGIVKQGSAGSSAIALRQDR